jgi:DegV family protein with EDD domain
MGVNMKIVISADSTCDLTEEICEKYNIHTNAMPFSLGENDLRYDKVTGTTKDVFDYVDRTGKLPTTSAYNEYEYTEHFNRLLQDYDAVIHISFSWEISSTGRNARLAAENMKNVYTVDSRNLSCGFGLVALECAIWAQMGKSVDEILAHAEEVKNKVQTSFIIDTLEYLHKGGRCSGVARIGAQLLKIKPKIEIIDGKMEVTKKYMGNINGCALRYCDELLKESNPDKKRAFIVSSSPVGAEEKIYQKLKDFGFEEIYKVEAGPSISIHCGRKTIGVMFIEK